MIESSTTVSLLVDALAVFKTIAGLFLAFEILLPVETFAPFEESTVALLDSTAFSDLILDMPVLPPGESPIAVK